MQYNHTGKPVGFVVSDLSRSSISACLSGPQVDKIIFRSTWRTTPAELLEELRLEKRARRLRDRAAREGWSAPELYTAINNGCRIGKIRGA